MAWLRLYITVEGQTERQFADTVLRPHLANFELDVRSRVAVTNRKLGKRGGIVNFSRIESDLLRLMREDRSHEARFTTMLDFYALPAEFPGWPAARQKAHPLERVETLEVALQSHFGDWRFNPYIQLHEFETLLYCDLTELTRRTSNTERAIKRLTQEVAHLEPEAINEGENTAPSKRLIRYVPLYEKLKVRVGAPAVAAIGLPILRQKCPHFADWLTQLEALAGTVT